MKSFSNLCSVAVLLTLPDLPPVPNPSARHRAIVGATYPAASGRSVPSLLDSHQCHVVTACHAGKADFALSRPALRHPVSDITRPTPQSSHSIAQVCLYRDDSKASDGRRCRPLAHAISTMPDQWSVTPYACSRSAGKRPAITMMALTSHCRTVFQTVSQIEPTCPVEQRDDFVPERHTPSPSVDPWSCPIYVARTSEPVFSGKCSDEGVDGGAARFQLSVAGSPEPPCPRYDDPAGSLLPMNP
jgi:hypothetical protein